jgi:dTDP-D-glucose 4,6-dehydratase
MGASIKNLGQVHDPFMIIDTCTVLVRQFGGPRYASAKVDICTGAGVRALFDRYQPDFVLNLAAESYVDRSIDGRRYGFRLLHVSTDEVCVTLEPEGLFMESTPYCRSGTRDLRSSE